MLPSAHVSGAATPANNVVNNTSGKVFENVRDIQAEYVIRQYEEMERYEHFVYALKRDNNLCVAG
jgi:hypothetical protein